MRWRRNRRPRCRAKSIKLAARAWAVEFSLLGGSLFLVAPALVGNLQAQQVPIPHTATEVPGPAAGPLTKAYVQMVGRMAYFWGWPLVYVYNQRTQLTNVPETGLLAGVMPISPMN